MALLPICRCWRLFLFGLTACLMCIGTSDRLSIQIICVPFLTIYTLCLLASLLPHRWCMSAQIFLCFSIDAICLVDLYCQEFFGSEITPQIVNMIIQTDGREVGDFLSTYFNVSILMRWRIVVLLGLIILLSLSFFCHVSVNCKKRVTSKANIISAIVILVMYAIEIPGQTRFLKLVTSNETIQDIEGMTFRKYDEGALTPIHRLILSLSVTGHTKELLQEMRRSTFSAQIDSCNHQSPHIVLVIGETYNKHHSQLYGYPLPTTPCQMKRKEQEDMYVFTDVVTPWNITSNVFTCAFSLWHYGDADSMGSYPFFPILFRRAGYDVRFFTNQYMQDGIRRTGTNQTGGFFLGDNILSDSLFNYRNSKPSTFDMGLVRQFCEYNDSVGNMPYTLDIIHLIGQHFNYRHRFPKPTTSFQCENYKNPHLSEEQKELIAAYDNATRYNDVVVDSILSLYENKDAIVIYMADHGEEIFDDLPVRGRLFQEPTSRQARQEFEIPFWIWCSQIYRQSHQELIESIRSSVDRPFMIDDLPQLLLYLAGINCKWTNSTNCLVSDDYNLSRPRILYGLIDYDNLIKDIRK